MERPTCKTCPFFEPILNPMDFEKDGPHGECRKLAPRTIPGLSGANDETFFPQMFGDHWCGEHADFPAYLASLKALAPQETTRP